MATIYIGEKRGAAVPVSRTAGTTSNTIWPVPRSTSVPSGVFIRLTSNTMWPGLRPTCMPSFILIRPTVWPQCMNVTDRTGQTNRQRSDSIGRIVLQTVAQKPQKPNLRFLGDRLTRAQHS